MCYIAYGGTPAEKFENPLQIITAISNPYIYIKLCIVPCHHGMGRPLVVDEGKGLDILRVAANI
jgi:hypothetical protein